VRIYVGQLSPVKFEDILCEKKTIGHLGSNARRNCVFSLAGHLKYVTFPPASHPVHQPNVPTVDKKCSHDAKTAMSTGGEFSSRYITVIFWGKFSLVQFMPRDSKISFLFWQQMA
jgi:hypothetical protein